MLYFLALLFLKSKEGKDKYFDCVCSAFKMTSDNRMFGFWLFLPKIVVLSYPCSLGSHSKMGDCVFVYFLCLPFLKHYDMRMVRLLALLLPNLHRDREYLLKYLHVLYFQSAYNGWYVRSLALFFWRNGMLEISPGFFQMTMAPYWCPLVSLSIKITIKNQNGSSACSAEPVEYIKKSRFFASALFSK